MLGGKGQRGRTEWEGEWECVGGFVGGWVALVWVETGGTGQAYSRVGGEGLRWVVG